MIVIIDYGTGNLRSVEKALQALGIPSVITRSKTEIKNASGIILPGVGAFDPAINELRKVGLEDVILEEIALKKPFLGICLGMQLLFSKSSEGEQSGLNVLKGTAKKFPASSLSVPHMGWNRLIIKRPSPILDGIESGAMMYFAHSYYVAPDEESIVSAETDYGINFASVISKDNLFGIQFHPEKSSEAGLKLLKNFGKLCLKERTLNGKI
jgi:glutamine amidotransferase